MVSILGRDLSFIQVSVNLLGCYFCNREDKPPWQGVMRVVIQAKINHQRVKCYNTFYFC